MHPFLSTLGPELDDAYEEVFALATHAPPSEDLGFVSRTATSLTVDLGSPLPALTIHQSPALLRSGLPGGTTGAVLWSITPLLARHLPALFFPPLEGGSTVLELGAGVSAVLALAIGPRVERYVASDQEYVLKLARKNLEENLPAVRKRLGRKGEGDVVLERLDWEKDDVRGLSALKGRKVDVVVAADCVYNEALVKPLVETCVDACRVGREETDAGNEGTVVVVAQELRSPAVMEVFLEEFVARFRAWRWPDERLPEELRSTSGFVIHLGVLREEEGV